MTEEAATCDTSVLIAALSSWHSRHTEARHLVRASVHALPSHCLLECYGVLTRLPASHRISPEIAGRTISGLDLELLTLPGDVHRTLVVRMAAAGLRGGAVYDALVAETARRHELTLLTLDSRARLTYETVGVIWRAL